MLSMRTVLLSQLQQCNYKIIKSYNAVPSTWVNIQEKQVLLITITSMYSTSKIETTWEPYMKSQLSSTVNNVY